MVEHSPRNLESEEKATTATSLFQSLSPFVFPFRFSLVSLHFLAKLT